MRRIGEAGRRGAGGREAGKGAAVRAERADCGAAALSIRPSVSRCRLTSSDLSGLILWSSGKVSLLSPFGAPLCSRPAAFRPQACPRCDLSAQSVGTGDMASSCATLLTVAAHSLRPGARFRSPLPTSKSEQESQ